MSVLATTVLVGIIAIAAVGMTRAQGRSARLDSDWSTAQLQAQNAIEGGLYLIHTNENWRDMLDSYNGTLGFYIGSSIATVVITDPADGDIANSPDDDVLLTATGTKGAARHKTQVTLEVIHEPLEALATCLHAGGNVTVYFGCILDVDGAPLSTNATLTVSGGVFGDVGAASIINLGWISGTETVPAPAKDLPDPEVAQEYQDLAETIPYVSIMETFVLTPMLNPWGAASPDGVYVIDTGGQNLVIKGARIRGTLIIRTHGGEVTIQDAVFMRPFRVDYPTLIVDGDLVLKLKSDTDLLDEADWGVNFNPPGAPYLGGSDTDTDDTYPNELRGLIHVTGNLSLESYTHVNGVIICEGAATIKDSPIIVHDPSLVTNPPEGYTTRKMQIAPGSWRQAVD
ncbi:hypothetical protein LCGC14_0162530 [marine sediment metagenome]|uniref:Type 4 fimbrial biogenesis protein PilX N-terminal domain-containing protein n=1 Tax=marine sediment metagenome TaxID=412755 RepID=A0A0F9VB52_9ZZZZ